VSARFLIGKCRILYYLLFRSCEPKKINYIFLAIGCFNWSFFFFQLNFKHSFQTRSGNRSDLKFGFWILTRLSNCPGQFYFFKSKRRRFSKKTKKSQRVTTGFLTGSCLVTPGFSCLYFFFNPARFQSRVSQIPSWPIRPSFKTILSSNQNLKWLFSSIIFNGLCLKRMVINILKRIIFSRVIFSNFY